MPHVLFTKGYAFWLRTCLAICTTLARQWICAACANNGRSVSRVLHSDPVCANSGSAKGACASRGFSYVHHGRAVLAANRRRRAQPI